VAAGLGVHVSWNPSAKLPDTVEVVTFDARAVVGVSAGFRLISVGWLVICNSYIKNAYCKLEANDLLHSHICDRGGINIVPWGRAVPSPVRVGVGQYFYPLEEEKETINTRVSFPLRTRGQPT